MHVVNTDSPSYQSKNPKKCLETAGKYKKRKYLDACLKQRRNFTPFYTLVKGLLRVESDATLKRFLDAIWDLISHLGNGRAI